jgi:3-dehydroquinate synthase
LKMPIGSVKSSITHWLAALGPALALILIPFALFGARLDMWSVDVLGTQTAVLYAFIAVVLLLAVDVVLPIPSSIVSTLGGAILGGPTGTIASWLGMTLGSLAGYALGRAAGPAVVRRLAGPVSLESLERDVRRYGARLVVTGRAVPVLAEATTLIAGAARMPLRDFVIVSSVANFGISAVYAVVGALSANVESFLLAVAGSILLPVLAWWLVGKRHMKGRA